MNEWSPGGNYIRPETPKHTGRSLRSQWDERESGNKAGSVNLRGTSHSRAKSRHQFFKDNMSKTSLNTTTKTKSKAGDSVTSDPRFKRIIPLGNQNGGTEAKKSKSTLDLQDAFKSKPANWTPPEFKPTQPIGDTLENTEKIKKSSHTCSCELECKTNPTETVKSDQSQDNLKLVEKLGFNHILAESFSKESLTDSCASTRNISLASVESGADFANNLDTFPSATRVKKVQNWMQDTRGKLDKKQSVVTVIGQTQGSDTISSALLEIGKRRKLVKQLDRYAVCRKIVESEKEKEISELFAKISSLTQAGKTWFCGVSNDESKVELDRSKVTECDQDKYSSNNSDNEKIVTHLNTKSKSYEFEPVKRKSKKADMVTECSIKGTTRLFLNRIPYQWIFCVLIFLCVILCGIVYITIQRNRYVSFDLFTPKPKPLTWYEKIGMWIWELFRPSAYYRRTAPWQQYLN